MLAWLVVLGVLPYVRVVWACGVVVGRTRIGGGHQRLSGGVPGMRLRAPENGYGGVSKTINVSPMRGWPEELCWESRGATGLTAGMLSAIGGLRCIKHEKRRLLKRDSRQKGPSKSRDACSKKI